jgi:uncharacterized protein YlxP (DUF503 family)
MPKNPEFIRKVRDAQADFKRLKAERRLLTIRILNDLAKKYYVSVSTIERWVYNTTFED